jgi:hypothetical protein
MRKDEQWRRRPNMKYLTLWLLITVSADAATWQRHVFTPKGDFLDTPGPHPLAYFTRDPFLRDDGDDFCTSCTPVDKAAVHAKHRFRTELKIVGELQGSTIYDLFYRFDDHIDSGQIDWKSILVETSPGQYREIYHLQPTQAQIGPSRFLKAGKDELLATRDLIPGTGNNYYEEYFWFGPDGPVRIDLDAIGKAVQSVLPADTSVWNGGGLDMESLSYHMPVWKKGDAHCCPTGGTVDVKFKLEAGRIVVTSKHFDPATDAGKPLG